MRQLLRDDRPILSLIFDTIQKTAPHFVGHDDVSYAAADTAETLLRQWQIDEPAIQQFFAQLFDLSPYLARLAKQLSPLLYELGHLSYFDFTEEARLYFRKHFPSIDNANIADVQRVLRHYKNAFAFYTAIFDILKLHDDEETTRFISVCAHYNLTNAATIARHHAAASLQLSRPKPELDGLLLIAMGKFGAYELNYSSDIDLMLFYDAEILAQSFGENPKYFELAKFNQRFIAHLVRILSDQTADGYVYRTDFRLRPDPSSSNVAVSMNMAQHYYESKGQNWERAALIKANIVVGHDPIASRFLQMRDQFVWRKYLDYDTIDDIQQMKRQIHHHHHIAATSDFYNYNVKLGIGGIREIEFFVQTQQLILGGQRHQLRDRSTLGMLQKFAKDNIISPETAQALREAYLFWRHVEHRIQMTHDAQDHKIPSDEANCLNLARFCGFQTIDDFFTACKTHQDQTHAAYQILFEDEEKQTRAPLVLTGIENDPHSLSILQQYGFEKPDTVLAILRGWHAGNIPATRHDKAQKYLQELIPDILQYATKAGQPDVNFACFAKYVASLNAGVQIFALFAKNPQALDNLFQIIALAPYLAEKLSRHSYYVEALIDGQFTKKIAQEKIQQALLSQIAVETPDIEKAMNHVRRVAGRARFHVAANLILHPFTDQQSNIDQYAAQFTALAESSIHALMPVVQQDMARKFGEIQKNGQRSEMAIVMFGRMGAGAMTVASDLDIVFVHEAELSDHSVGENIKSIDSTTWFTRYVRRLITSITTPTEEGGLYEVDMQLRPSGGSGPTAVSMAAFEKYYRQDADVWEEMALVKARILSHNLPLKTALENEIDRILTKKRDEAHIRARIVDMRARLQRDRPAKSLWHFKDLAGGLTDIEFICQYFALREAHKLGRFPVHNRQILKLLLDKALISPKDHATLMAAYNFFDMMIHQQRSRMGPKKLLPSADDYIQQATLQQLGIKDIEEAEQLIQQHAHKVLEISTRIFNDAENYQHLKN